MPDIVATSGNDLIDVINDSGTLNGSGAGTPIDNIRARNGDDIVTVTDSTLVGEIRLAAGADDLTVVGSSIGGTIRGGGGADTITVSHSSVFDIRGGADNDVVNFWNTSVSADIRGNAGTDSLNLPAGTMVVDSTFGSFTVVLAGAYSLSSGTFTLQSGAVVTYSTFEDGVGIPCFVRGAMIATARGLVRVETLQVGDRVRTQESGWQPVRWIGRRRVSAGALDADPKLWPVRIRAGALGPGLPTRDLWVSRQHRMLVRSKIAERMFGCGEVFVPAIKLVSLPGVDVEEPGAGVEYLHILLDRHEVIYANGCPTESLFTGPGALDALGAEAVAELHSILPALACARHAPVLAKPVPIGRQQKQLVARHAKNAKPILSACVGP